MKYTLHNANLIEILPGKYKDRVDLILTSPPYDGMRNYEGYEFNFDRVADAIVPCLKEGGMLVWIVADQIINRGESLNSFRQAIGFQERGLIMHQTLIYQNAGPRAISPNRCLRDLQYMFCLSKGKPKTAHIPKDRVNVSAGTTRRAHGAGRHADGVKASADKCKTNRTYTIGEVGTRSQIWKYSTGLFHSAMEETHQFVSDIHPAVFPVKLAIDHVRCWTDEGDLVLDPMAGSGTTLSASIITGREAHGIEISAKYCEGARERLRREHDGMLELKTEMDNKNQERGKVHENEVRPLI